MLLSDVESTMRLAAAVPGQGNGELYTSASALAYQYKDDLFADFPEVFSFRSAFVSTIKEIELGSRFGTHSIHKAPLHITKSA